MLVPDIVTEGLLVSEAALKEKPVVLKALTSYVPG
jgi:hypothetical protein